MGLRCFENDTSTVCWRNFVVDGYTIRASDKRAVSSSTVFTVLLEDLDFYTQKQSIG